MNAMFFIAIYRILTGRSRGSLMAMVVDMGRIALIAVAAVPAYALAAGFDCHQATTKVEKLVCSDNALSDLDSKLDSLYRQKLLSAAPAERSALVKTQKVWLASVRNACGDVSCLHDAYEARLQSLEPTPSAMGASSASSPIRSIDRNDLQALLSSNGKLLDVRVGDLKGNGDTGALVVLDPLLSKDDKLGEGPPRTVFVVIRDAQGQLRPVAQNNKLVPCARCGGVAGDPFSSARIESGRFTVVIEGGSREHWWSEYQFKYAPKLDAWLVDKVVRGASDSLTGRTRKAAFSAQRLGAVEFSKFDPGSVPEVYLK